ncbi:MAG TPA: hypothetical protein VK902_03160 [Rubrobacter sp.]|jgi:hypothetical protein|nr:hypothetical protein [Rubrobacter sp.]
MDTAYLSGLETGSRYAWERAGVVGNPPGWGPQDEESTNAEDFDAAIDAQLEATGASLEVADIMPEFLTSLEEKTTQEAWTLFEAFAIFCRKKLEVEPAVRKANPAAVVAGLGFARQPPGTLYGSSGR